jgi:hypothetical protein
VPDGVDAFVALVKPPGPDPVLDCVTALPELGELPIGNDRVLPIGEVRDRPILFRDRPIPEVRDRPILFRDRRFPSVIGLSPSTGSETPRYARSFAATRVGRGARADTMPAFHESSNMWVT